MQSERVKHFHELYVLMLPSACNHPALELCRLIPVVTTSTDMIGNNGYFVMLSAAGHGHTAGVKESVRPVKAFVPNSQ